MESSLNPDDFKSIAVACGNVTLKELCRHMVEQDTFSCTVALPTHGMEVPVHIVIAMCPAVSSDGLRKLVKDYLDSVITD